MMDEPSVWTTVCCTMYSFKVLEVPPLIWHNRYFAYGQHWFLIQNSSSDLDTNTLHVVYTIQTNSENYVEEVKTY
jgi:hypothetical protein